MRETEPCAKCGKALEPFGEDEDPNPEAKQVCASCGFELIGESFGVDGRLLRGMLSFALGLESAETRAEMASYVHEQAAKLGREDRELPKSDPVAGPFYKGEK